MISTFFFLICSKTFHFEIINSCIGSDKEIYREVLCTHPPKLHLAQLYYKIKSRKLTMVQSIDLIQISPGIHVLVCCVHTRTALQFNHMYFHVTTTTAKIFNFILTTRLIPLFVIPLYSYTNPFGLSHPWLLRITHLFFTFVIVVSWMFYKWNHAVCIILRLV